jgi:CRISPR-associated protein Csb2
MKYLVITIRFLGDRYHGRMENGREPEWPPSPLRLYQAVVAGVAPRWQDTSLRDQELPALEWLQSLAPPQIIAPKACRGRALLKYVRENLSDVDPEKREEKRDAKISRPTLFCAEPKVKYCWSIDPEQDQCAERIASCARHCRALGWGIDMAIADGVVSEAEPESGAGEMWLPTPNTGEGVPLRVPRAQAGFGEGGTISELMNRFSASLRRISEDGRNPVAPLTRSAFRTVGYRRATDAPSRSVAAFSLLDLEASRFVAFDTASRALTVAGMMRHAAKTAAARSGWPGDAFILGHSASGDSEEHVAVGPRRFAYLPLPSIQARGEGRDRVAGSVRRVMLSTFAGGCEDEIAWARRTLSGEELINHDKKRVAILSLIPANEGVVRCYTRTAAEWATVTPVVLPGYDDPRHYRRRLKGEIGAQEQKELLGRLEERIDGLVRKAIVQAGFSEVLAEHAQIDWRQGGFWPGTDLADRYGVPDHLKRFPRLHVSIQWRNADGNPVQIPGPICLGGGRFYGLGLFAAV